MKFSKSILPLFACFIVFISVRIVPYLFSSVPTGYDAGLYLYLLKQYDNLPILSFGGLTPWLIAQFPPGIALAGRVFTYFVPPETLLVPFLVLLSVLLFAAVYLLARRFWGRDAALWSAIFLSASALQFREWWYYYAKQIAASSMLLLAFYLFAGGSYWALPFTIAIAYTHQPACIVLIAAIAAGLLFDKRKRRYYLTVGVVTAIAAAFYYIPTFSINVAPLLSPVVRSLVPKSAGGTMFTPSGTFYDWLPALLLVLPYIPFAVVGFIRDKEKRDHAPLIGGLVATLVIVILGLFLSRRFIVFADMFLILYAGWGVAYIVKTYGKRRFVRQLLLLYTAFLLVFIVSYVVKTGSAPITEDELAEISLLRQTEPDSYVLVTDNEYMPWVYGWSDRRTIAPGYGQYDTFWTIPEWHAFWEIGDRILEHELLLKLPKPLYIYAGDHQRQYVFDLTGECFTRINWRTYKFTCEK
ncbi:hypothetical protein KKB64_02790 [Patescibacteria group bacterium]|nr:hypothetical protein [Patescibacteria group bacterium]MBU1472685.1 hypothetical protein [Patescibacteria group bacterium]MBU2460130.1 hypothetical protein [Patescibacteria group bacterium]MBU2544389.1 hypothetical protein [Patescibacteria group bacterium]